MDPSYLIFFMLMPEMCTHTLHTLYTHIPSPSRGVGKLNTHTHTESQTERQIDFFLYTCLWPNNGLVLQQVPLPVGAISIVKVHLLNNDC